MGDRRILNWSKLPALLQEYLRDQGIGPTQWRNMSEEEKGPLIEEFEKSFREEFPEERTPLSTGEKGVEKPQERKRRQGKRIDLNKILGVARGAGPDKSSVLIVGAAVLMVLGFLIIGVIAVPVNGGGGGGATPVPTIPNPIISVTEVIPTSTPYVVEVIPILTQEVATQEPVVITTQTIPEKRIVRQQAVDSGGETGGVNTQPVGVKSVAVLETTTWVLILCAVFLAVVVFGEAASRGQALDGATPILALAAVLYQFNQADVKGLIIGAIILGAWIVGTAILAWAGGWDFTPLGSSLAAFGLYASVSENQGVLLILYVLLGIELPVIDPVAVGSQAQAPSYSLVRIYQEMSLKNIPWPTMVNYLLMILGAVFLAIEVKRRSWTAIIFGLVVAAGFITLRQVVHLEIGWTLLIWFTVTMVGGFVSSPKNRGASLRMAGRQVSLPVSIEKFSPWDVAAMTVICTFLAIVLWGEA